MKILQHRFEIYTLVSEIQDAKDLFFCMKNLFELEAELSCGHSELRIQNRAIPAFPLENLL